MTNKQLRLWQVEVGTDGRDRYRMKRHTVNVAAYDIIGAIDGALDHLSERFEDWNHATAWVISANHKGVVNRVEEY